MNLPSFLRRSKVETRSSGPVADFLAARAWARTGGGAVPVKVTDETALRMSAVFASIRILAETVASLPLDVYERSDSGRDVEVRSHPVSELFRDGPTPVHTPISWTEGRVSELLRFGDAHAGIKVDRRTNEVYELAPLSCGSVAPYLSDERRDRRGRKSLRYRVSQPGEQLDLDRSQVLHVSGFGTDGLHGWSVVRMAAGSIRRGFAGDRLITCVFENSGKPSLVVQVPGELSDEAFARLQRQIETEISGDNIGKPLLLEHGAAASPMSMPLADAQVLESVKFTGAEIASRWFRLPPHMAGFLDDAHYNNIDSQDRAFLTHTMLPYLLRFEQEFNRKLFRGDQRGRFYVRFNVDAVHRGDLKTRYDAHRSGLMGGWLTTNEVRAMEDRQPLEGGDELPRPAAIWGKPEANPKPTADDLPVDPVDDADEDADDAN